MKECSVCAAAARVAVVTGIKQLNNGNIQLPPPPQNIQSYHNGYTLTQHLVYGTGPIRHPAAHTGILYSNGDCIDIHKHHSNGSPKSGHSGGPSDPTAGVRRGKCKWFNVAKGWGFITPEDGGQDVFVHQSVIKMPGFRSLGDGEVVEFECKVSGKGLEATRVSGPSSGDCHGSHRRPISKKRFRKMRCYNCGEFANHIAAKCTIGPQPKRCHNCKSDSHLIADCPNKAEKKKGDESSEESKDN